MTNYFRQAIAKRVFSALGIGRSEADLTDFVKKCAPMVRLNKKNTNPPCLELSWNDVCKQFQIPNNEITTNLIQSLKGNGVILADGIVDVSGCTEEKWKLRFIVNKDAFIGSVLSETHTHVNSYRKISFLLKSIPLHKHIIEYSSPNVAKPFHVGHIRSTIIGNTLANLHKYLGHDVTRINYLGDWGLQYGLLTAGYDKFASEEELAKNPINHLYEVYVASNEQAINDPEFVTNAKEILRKMERDEDNHLVNRWKTIRKLSLDEFSKIYNRLGIEFDAFEYESMYYKNGLSIAEDLHSRKLASLAENGALTMDIIGSNNQPITVTILRKDKATLYLTRDIVAAIDRKTHRKFDKMFYIVDLRQMDHFSNLKFILNQMGHDWADQIEHVSFGQIGGMSTRKGNVIFLDEILDKAKKLALKSMENSQNTKVTENPEDIAETLGTSAIIINDLKLRRQINYQFDWNRALHIRGDSGISLQYSHARLASIDRTFLKLFNFECNFDLLLETEALNLVCQLAKFDEALFEMYQQNQPSILVKYLFRLCFYMGKANVAMPLHGTPRREAEPRYMLFLTTKMVLKQGLEILGIKPLDRM